MRNLPMTPFPYIIYMCEYIIWRILWLSPFGDTVWLHFHPPPKSNIFHHIEKPIKNGSIKSTFTIKSGQNCWMLIKQTSGYNIVLLSLFFCVSLRIDSIFDTKLYTYLNMHEQELHTGWIISNYYLEWKLIAVHKVDKNAHLSAGIIRRWILNRVW